MVDNSAGGDGDARLLTHLARNRLLQSLARVDKSSQAAIPTLWPLRLSAEEAALAVGREDGRYDHRICAREVHRAAICADTLPAAFGIDTLSTAYAAIRMILVPQQQIPRLTGKCGLGGGRRTNNLTQANKVV